jgi:hypothetical protein
VLRAKCLIVRQQCVCACVCVCDIPGTTYIDVHYAVTYYTCHIRVFVVTSFTVLVLLTAMCTSQSLLNRSGHILKTCFVRDKYEVLAASCIKFTLLCVAIPRSRLITYQSEGYFTSVCGAENVGSRFFPNVNIPIFQTERRVKEDNPILSLI